MWSDISALKGEKLRVGLVPGRAEPSEGAFAKFEPIAAADRVRDAVDQAVCRISGDQEVRIQDAGHDSRRDHGDGGDRRGGRSDVTVGLEPAEAELVGPGGVEPTGLEQDVVAGQFNSVAALDLVRLGIFGVDLDKVLGPTPIDERLASRVESRLPELVDPANGDPEFANLVIRFDPLIEVGK